MNTAFVITPFTLVNPTQLVDVTVAAKPLDDLRKDEVFVGFVDEIKFNRMGTFVHFHSDDLNLSKWIKADRVIGYAHLPTPTPMMALADEVPNVAIDVLMEQEVIAAAPVIETPAVAAQPAHVTDAGRYQGIVSYVTAFGHGYISDINGGDIQFLTRNVLGHATLVKGMAVTYTTGAYTNCALTIVATGNTASEAAYTRLMDRKATAPLPRARRNRDMNAQTVRAPQA